MPFSEKIHRPELQKHRNLFKGIRWGVLLPLTVAILAVAWGISHFAPDLIPALTIWGVAGITVALIIFFYLVLPLIRQGGYEGVVYNKKIVKTRVKEGQDQETYTQYHFAPILFVRISGGRKQQLEVSKEAYAYFSIGDTIKMHRGFSHPERRDKEGDSIIVCLRCGRTYKIASEQCPHCRMPNICEKSDYQSSGVRN